MLHHKLQKLYREAELEIPDVGDARHTELACRAQSVAKAYAGLDDRFAVLLENFVQDLFTLVRYLHGAYLQRVRTHAAQGGDTS